MPELEEKPSILGPGAVPQSLVEVPPTLPPPYPQMARRHGFAERKGLIIGITTAASAVFLIVILTLGVVGGLIASKVDVHGAVVPIRIRNSGQLTNEICQSAYPPVPMEVRVITASGRVYLGQTAEPHYNKIKDRCEERFSIKVPSSDGPYSIALGRDLPLRYTKEQLKSPITLLFDPTIG